MTNIHFASDEELPDLSTLIYPKMTAETIVPALRRSPRKHNHLEASDVVPHSSTIRIPITLTVTSNQRVQNSTRSSPSKRSPLKKLQQPQTIKRGSDEGQKLSQRTASYNEREARCSQELGSSFLEGPRLPHVDSLLLPMSRASLTNDSKDVQTEYSLLHSKARKSSNTRSIMSLMTEAGHKQSSQPATDASTTSKRSYKPKTNLPSRRFILDEATCDDDLIASDANNDGEEEETDLSGFIVDDGAELSYHESMGSDNGSDSEDERRRRRQIRKGKPRRRLHRGRKRVDDSEDELTLDGGINDELADAFKNMGIGGPKSEHRRNLATEVIDLVSPDQSPMIMNNDSTNLKLNEIAGEDLFDKFKALKLSPPRGLQKLDLSIKDKADMPATLVESGHRRSCYDEPDKDKVTTPPATPPRSPTKLKSPSKHLLSPSKKVEGHIRSPHRPSLDAFWDHNVINEFNDQFSPRKLPLTSPRKLLERFNLWSDSEDADDATNASDNLDSPPSPCESPSKRKTKKAGTDSTERLEKKKLQDKKRADRIKKQEFNANKDRLARELLNALDKHVANSRLSSMTASTGGISIIWSKTLRSTAGRAHWRRTVAKSTGSPIKVATIADEKVSGNRVDHSAKIELAIKIIDRPERLISTLTHEFCHLANYMISGVRDQPHGPSFHQWGAKCTSWLREESGRAEWRTAEVATKHNYEIDFKYLWICSGRARTLAMDMLNLEDDIGCGLEYGRHSKSIDTETHRCGRCKGRLVQIRPKPRASPSKLSPAKRAVNLREVVSKIGTVENSVEIFDLSD